MKKKALIFLKISKNILPMARRTDGARCALRQGLWPKFFGSFFKKEQILNSTWEA
jgi:hypothetical protein